MTTAFKRLNQEYKQLTNDPPEGVAAGPVNDDDFFVWEALIVGPQDTPYESGCFLARLKFPPDYPFAPPKMTFLSEMWHPNVYANGDVCISILHAPGADPMQYEADNERWTPSQSVEKILLSVMSMLAEPNPESGANIECCKMWRNDREAFNRRVQKTVEKSLGLASSSSTSSK